MAFVLSAFAVVMLAVTVAYWLKGPGLDLHIYRQGIDAFQNGKNPYTGRYASNLNFTYPPVALLVLAPLTWFSFASTLAALWLITVVLLSFSIDLAARASGRGGPALRFRTLGWACLAVLVLEPVRSTLDFGQINVILMAMVVVDLLAVPKERRGWLIGLAAAIKLTPAIFLLIPLLERDWKTLGRGVGAAVAGGGLMAVLWPAASRTYWLKDFLNAHRVGTIGYEGNQSWNGLLHRFPFPADGSPALWVVLSLLTLVLGVVVARDCLARHERVQAMLAIALTGLLISPISWTHHWVWVALIPVVLSRGRASLPTPARRMLGAVLVTSIAAPYFWFRHGGAVSLRATSLTLIAFAALAVWAFSLERNKRRRSADLEAVPAQPLSS
jgi:alpha-1,2-mannosyltransferase